MDARTAWPLLSLSSEGCPPSTPACTTDPLASSGQHLHVNSRCVLHHPLHDCTHVPGFQGTESVPSLHTLAQHL